MGWRLPWRPTMTTDSDTTKPAAKPRARAVKTAVATTLTPAIATSAKAATKSGTVIKLLLRAKGATPTELIAATDWQPHSLRAFLSGLRKKGRELIREERKGGGYAYRIVAGKDGPAGEQGAGAPPEAASADAAPNDALDGAATTGQPVRDGEDA